MTYFLTPEDREDFLKTLTDATDNLISLSGVAEKNAAAFGDKEGYILPDTAKTLQILYQLYAMRSFIEYDYEVNK